MWGEGCRCGVGGVKGGDRMILLPPPAEHKEEDKV